MGDGRYYTFYQFFGILLLVMFSMFALMSAVAGYYRNSGNQKEKKILPIFYVLSILMILKTIEIIIPSLITGVILRSVISVLLIYEVIKWNVYLNENIFSVVKSTKLWIAEIFSGIVAFLVMITKGNFLFNKYNFYHTEFTNYYKAIWIVIFGINLFYCFMVLFSKKQKHKIYKNIGSFIILFLFMILPFGTYTYMLGNNIVFLDYAEIFILIMLSAILNIILYSQSPSGITILTFNKIGDIISDYIIVTDNKGRIIYKNSRVNQSDCFESEEIININNLSEIYRTDAMKMYNPDGEEYMKISNEKNDRYFTHRCDPLKNKKDTIGYIITIVEISELMELLNRLKEVQEKAKDTNNKLKNYAEVVYNAEKEKEINMLLEKILFAREKDMYQLIADIEEILKEEIKNEFNFQEKIEILIKYNQKTLEEVRKTVSAYR